MLLSTLLRDVKARQSLARDALEGDKDVVPVAPVGSQANVGDARQLSQALIAAIGFNRAEFRARASAEDAFGYLPYVHEPYEVNYWIHALGCTKAELETAGKTVGRSAVAVRRHLGK